MVFFSFLSSKKNSLIVRFDFVYAESKEDDDYEENNSCLDLVNVAFQQPDGGWAVPDRLTAMQAFEEIQSIYPSVRLNLVLVNVTKAELQEKRENCIRDLLHPLDTVLDDSIGCAIWFATR